MDIRGFGQLPTFDAQRLANLTPDASVQDRMRAAFLRQLPSIVEDIRRAAMPDASAADWRSAVHKLHGACLAIGATRASAMLKVMESGDGFDSAAARARALEALDAELEDLTRHLAVDRQSG